MQILTFIFEHITTRERSRIRLVCRKWNLLTNSASILQSEKLVLTGSYNISDILGLLNRSQRELLNLEFRSVIFRDDAAPFWAHCGHRIRNLVLSCCTVSNLNVEELILNCHNLLSMTWFYPIFSSNMKDVLAKLIDTKTVRKSLTSLEMQIQNNYSSHISNYSLCRIFAIYPAIADITLTCDSASNQFFSHTITKPEIHSSDLLTFSSILTKLIWTPQRIRKLRITTSPCPMQKNNFFIRTISSIPNLTRFGDMHSESRIVNSYFMFHTRYIWESGRWSSLG